MTTFYLICAVLGGVLVLLQSGFGLVHHAGQGGGPGHHAGSDLATHDTLDMLSLRTLSAGLAAFGLIGGLLNSLGLWWVLGLLAAGAAGIGVMYAVALVIRQMGRLERDNSLVMEGAIGEEATVYLPIPAGKSGRGKITTILQSQIIELEAVTDGAALGTGEKVLITDINGSLAEVIPLRGTLEGAP